MRGIYIRERIFDYIERHLFVKIFHFVYPDRIVYFLNATIGRQ